MSSTVPPDAFVVGATTRYALSIAALVVGMGLAACEPLEDVFVDEPVDPACQGASVDVQGTWEITGTGARSDCDDSTYDTSFFDLSSLPLSVVQNGDALEVDATDLPATFTFADGFVNGRCVEFRTLETVEDLGVIEYEWVGTVSETGALLSGAFSGSGPPGCRVRGNFRVDFPQGDD